MRTVPLSDLPRTAAALLRRDLATWSLTAVALGALEGGLLGVLVKERFDGAAPAGWVNFAVAVVAGAPAFSNLVSLAAARWSHARPRVPLLRRLLVVLGICLFALALPPVSAWGMVWFCLAALLGRVAWSGVLTLRAALWRSNYARSYRGRVASRVAQLAALIMAATSAGIGAALDVHEDAFRVLYPLAGLAAFWAAWVYRGTRQRHQWRFLAAERDDVASGPPGVSAMWRVLRQDRAFRQYMAAMMLFGSGNLMVLALLVVTLSEQLGVERSAQVLITSSVPLVFLCFSTRAWGRFLDQRHILAYRAVHSWFFVAAFVAFAAGAVAGLVWPFWLGSALLGLATGGAYVGWNLGHNDFTDDARSSLYMAIHVTLTGLRGGLMPLVGVGLYQWLEVRADGAGRWAMLLPLALSFAGAVAFVAMDRARRRATPGTESSA